VAPSSVGNDIPDFSPNCGLTLAGTQPYRAVSGRGPQLRHFFNDDYRFALLKA
jgi:hypothetical protein